MPRGRKAKAHAPISDSVLRAHKISQMLCLRCRRPSGQGTMRGFEQSSIHSCRRMVACESSGALTTYTRSPSLRSAAHVHAHAHPTNRWQLAAHCVVCNGPVFRLVSEETAAALMQRQR